MRLMSAMLLGAVLFTSPAFAQTEPAADPVAPPGSIIIEPGEEKPLPPDGDPRSVGERREDRIAYNKCLLRAQSQDPQPGSATLPDTPEDYCSRKMGMENADAIPNSVRGQ